MSEVVLDRFGRPLGKRAQETRGRVLDALRLLIEKPGRDAAWSRLTPIAVAREAGASPASFYGYFDDLEDAVIELAVHLEDAGEKFPDHLSGILGLLAIEGWELPEFPKRAEAVAVDA